MWRSRARAMARSLEYGEHKHTSVRTQSEFSECLCVQRTILVLLTAPSENRARSSYKIRRRRCRFGPAGKIAFLQSTISMCKVRACTRIGIEKLTNNTGK